MKTMKKEVIGADATKLAGLQIDLLQKVRSGQITIRQLEGFNNLSSAERESCFAGSRKEGKPGHKRFLEELKSRFAPFLTETFTLWYDKETAEKTEQKLSLAKPEDIDWEALKNDIDKAKFGEYSLNPETQGLNFESFPHEKIKVFDFKEFVGKPRAELAKHLALNYADKYHIPGIEYWKYVIENPDKAPDSLKDGNYHYFFGSTLRHRHGYANVPHAYWDGGRFDRSADWLDFAWRSNDRVVLLEK